MATHDYNLANQSGASFRSDLNDALQAILTNNSSASAPSSTASYMFWADTNTGILKIRNSANSAWIELLQLDGTLTLEDGSASAVALGFRDELNTGIFSSGANNFDVSIAGTTRLNISASGINITGTVTDDGATHDGDVTFTGASANIVFDKSDNALEFADNAKAVFGAGSDLTISHDGSNSIINDAGTGELQLQRAGNTIFTLDATGVTVSDPDGTAALRVIGFEGSNATLSLICDEGDDNGDTWQLSSRASDNTLKMLNNTSGSLADIWTISTAGDVTQTGNLTLSDSKEILLGAGNDFKFRHDGTDNHIVSANGDINIQVANGEDAIIAKPNGTVELYHDNSKKFETSSTGASLTGNLDVSSGLDVTGNITVSGTVDGRDVASDGSKLDGIESSATADQTASEILTLIKTVDGSGSGLDADTLDGVEGANYLRSNTTDSFTGDTLTFNSSTDQKIILAGSASPYIRFQESGTNKAYIQWNSAGHFQLVNQETGSTLKVGSDGTSTSEISGNFTIGGQCVTKIGTAASPGIAFGPADTDTGFYRDVGGNINISLNGNGIYRFTTSRFQPEVDNQDDLGGSSKRWDDVRATNGTIQTSDKNSKNTITATDLGLDFINKLTPVSYKFNKVKNEETFGEEKAGTRTHYGLIAQDIETLLGTIGKSATDFAGFCKDEKDEQGNDLSEPLYGLRYNEFIAPIIKAIQELSAKVAALEAA